MGDREYKIWYGDVANRWFLQTRSRWTHKWDLIATFASYEEAILEQVRLEKLHG